MTTNRVITCDGCGKTVATGAKYLLRVDALENAEV